MRSLFVILLAANMLMFGLGQGWFGATQTEPGRNTALLETQLNAQALQLAEDRSRFGQ